MGMHYFFQGGFTVSRGVIQNYDQWLFTPGLSLSTPGKGQRAMKWQSKCSHQCHEIPSRRTALVCWQQVPSRADYFPLEEMIGRANDQVSKFVEQFSDVKCTEHVTQEKFKADGKVELKEDSTYDYLVILTNAGGEINLDESRLAVHEQKKDAEKGCVHACQQWIRDSVSRLPPLLFLGLSVHGSGRRYA